MDKSERALHIPKYSHYGWLPQPPTPSPASIKLAQSLKNNYPEAQRLGRILRMPITLPVSNIKFLPKPK